MGDKRRGAVSVIRQSWASSMRAENSPLARSSDPFAEIRDGVLQPFFEWHLGLPTAEHFFRKRDVGTTLLRIVGGQRLVDDLGFAADELERELRDLEHRELARVAEIHRTDRFGLRH